MNSKSVRKYSWLLATALTPFIFGYAVGTYSFAHQLWPVNIVVNAQNKSAELQSRVNFSELGGYSNLSDKAEVSCPEQDSRTMVILVIGQSNSANHAEAKFSTHFPKRVLNYYLEKCFVSGSPLLGASGDEGEWLTPLADELIVNKNVGNIIIINKSIGQSTISDWINGGRFTSDLVLTLRSLRNQYTVTHVLWHQGESDFAKGTSSQEYYSSFLALRDLLANEEIDAPIYSFISTVCGHNPKWTQDNGISNAVRKLITDGVAKLAVDTDSVLLPQDRRDQSPAQEPNCHLSEAGQLRIAKLLANQLKD